jgi:hypothetical protein
MYDLHGEIQILSESGNFPIRKENFRLVPSRMTNPHIAIPSPRCDLISIAIQSIGLRQIFKFNRRIFIFHEKSQNGLATPKETTSNFFQWSNTPRYTS